MFGMDSGEYPLSEPESRGVVDAFSEHPHVGCALTMHTYTGCILTQPYRTDTPMADGDIEMMKLLAEDLAEGTDYDVFQVCPEFMYEEGEPIPGVWADTISTVFGVPGYTVELWDPFAHVDVEIDSPAEFFQDPDQETVREMLRGFAEGDGNVREWQSVEHPQLGAVEVGGLEYLRTIRNPPPDLLAEDCERAATMANRARRALPEVEAEIEVTSLGEGRHEVQLVLENLGFLPTSGLARGEQVSSTPEIGVALNLADGMQTDAPERRQLEHMEGWGNLRTGPGRHPAYAGLSTRGHRSWVSWKIEGDGEVEIEWLAGRGGRGSEVVEL